MNARRRRAFTLIELLTVFVILGIVLTLAAPKINTSVIRMSVNSARDEVAAYLAQARALAIQNGRVATVARTGNEIVLTVGTGSTIDTVARKDLLAEHGVTLEPLTENAEKIQFDPRGFAIPSGVSPTRVLRLSREDKQAVVCLIGLGKIAKDGSECALFR